MDLTIYSRNNLPLGDIDLMNSPRIVHVDELFFSQNGRNYESFGSANILYGHAQSRNGLWTFNDEMPIEDGLEGARKILGRDVDAILACNPGEYEINIDAIYVLGNAGVSLTNHNRAGVKAFLRPSSRGGILKNLPLIVIE